MSGNTAQRCAQIATRFDVSPNQPAAPVHQDIRAGERLGHAYPVRRFDRYPPEIAHAAGEFLGVSRPTATKYLDLLDTAGFVRKKKVGRSNFYINEPLFALLSNITLPSS